MTSGHLMPYVIAITTAIAFPAAWIFLFREVMKHPNHDNDYTSGGSAL